MLIQDSSSFADVLGQCRSEGCFAFDTEFIRERRYAPKLCLVQIGVAGRCVAIDPFAVGGLSELVDLLEDGDIVKLVHAGQQDMEIFFAGTGRLPHGLFDTQIAAALSGWGDSIGYSKLVESLANVRLSKAQTFTDWAQRPLSAGQIDYALDDVRYLPGIHERLISELESLGRMGWLIEEMRVYENPAFYRRDPATLYRRVKGASRLNRRELGILRELASWREQEAESRDRPRGHIIGDEVLVELSRMKPKSLGNMKTLRGVHPQLLRRSGEEIIRQVKIALDLPKSELPEIIEKPAKDSGQGLVVDLLETFLKARAKDNRIGPGYVATRSELYELARLQREGGIGSGASDAGNGSGVTKAALRVLEGWRRDLIGNELLGLLEGRYSLAIEPQGGGVVISERPKPDAAG